MISDPGTVTDLNLRMGIRTQKNSKIQFQEFCLHVKYKLRLKSQERGAFKYLVTNFKNKQHIVNSRIKIILKDILKVSNDSNRISTKVVICYI